MDNQEQFSFTYSAQQQREIEAIRRKYLPQEENQMEQLRKLHRVPTQKAQAASIAVGVIGTLILGTGLSICLTELGDAIGTLRLLLAVGIGVPGMGLVALAYPLYHRILKKEREKIAPEILRLTDALLR
jgi:hypothetical protein